MEGLVIIIVTLFISWVVSDPVTKADIKKEDK